MTDNNNRNTLKEAFDAELMKRLEENPPEIPTYEEFSAMVDKSLAERCRRRKRIAGIAAGFVVVLLAGILACTNLTTDVDADKNPKEEIITEDGVIIEDGGWGSSDGEDNVWVIDSWHDVKGAKVRFPEMLVPEYIPEGYEFKDLRIETTGPKMLVYEYSFDDKKNTIEIEIQHYSSAMNSFEVNNITRNLECNRGTIYIQERGNKIATIQIDDGINIYVIGNITDDDIINVIQSFNL